MKNTEQEQRFGHLLKKKQIASRYELAKLTGITQSTINDLLSGKSDYQSTKHYTLESIAETLGMSIDRLDEVILDGDEPEKRYIVETVVLDKDGCIKYSTDRDQFDSLEEAQQYFDHMVAEKGCGFILYNLNEIVCKKGIK